MAFQLWDAAALPSLSKHLNEPEPRPSAEWGCISWPSFASGTPESFILISASLFLSQCASLGSADSRMCTGRKRHPCLTHHNQLAVHKETNTAHARGKIRHLAFLAEAGTLYRNTEAPSQQPSYLQLMQGERYGILPFCRTRALQDRDTEAPSQQPTYYDSCKGKDTASCSFGEAGHFKIVILRRLASSPPYYGSCKGKDTASCSFGTGGHFQIVTLRRLASSLPRHLGLMVECPCKDFDDFRNNVPQRCAPTDGI